MKITGYVVGVAAAAIAAAVFVAGCTESQAPAPTPEARPPAGATTGAEATVATAGNQTTCPIMGGKIDKRYYADYKGKRVYFCCPGCDEAFKKDPEAAIKKLEGQGVVLATTPSGEAGP